MRHHHSCSRPREYAPHAAAADAGDADAEPIHLGRDLIPHPRHWLSRVVEPVALRVTADVGGG